MRKTRSSAKTSAGIPFTAEQIHAFRLRRHHLLDASGKDLVTICRDVCGVQAQIMSAAQLQFWARNPAITPAAVNEALWQKRSLVKTTVMRQTLHLIPAEDFPLYIAAQKNARVRSALSIMARLKVTREEADGLSDLILDELRAGPATRAAITAAVRPKVGKRMREWIDKVWSIVRLPVFEGLVCCGPGEGNQATFIRMDQWLPAHTPLDETQARAELLRRYLRAYGPATIKDFAHWCGVSMPEARAARPFLDGEVLDHDGLLLLRDDAKAMASLPAQPSSVHLLPYFDVYLLAHALKDHLVEPRFYKRVYRNQAWISPVVLIDGKIAGVWTHKLSRKEFQVQVELFARVGRASRDAIEAKAQGLAALFQRDLSFSIAR